MNRSQVTRSGDEFESDIRFEAQEEIVNPPTLGPSPPEIMPHISGLRSSADRRGTRMNKRNEK